MAQNKLDADDIVAIKCIDKKALRGKEDSLENEIRVLRRLVKFGLARAACKWSCSGRRAPNGRLSRQ